MADRRERGIEELCDVAVVKTGNAYICWDFELELRQGLQQTGGSVVVAADECVWCAFPTHQAGEEGFIGRIRLNYEVFSPFQLGVDCRLCDAMDAASYCASVVRLREKSQALRPCINHVFGDTVAGLEVVDAHEIVKAAFGRGQIVAVDQHNWDVAAAKYIQHRLCRLGGSWHEVDRFKKDARHLPFRKCSGCG